MANLYCYTANLIPVSERHKDLIIIVMGAAIIVLLLVVIYISFRFVLPVTGKKRGLIPDSHLNEKDALPGTSPDGETMAAISMALHLHLNEMHDEESNIITIKRVSRLYSPWSSKLYNMRNLR